MKLIQVFNSEEDPVFVNMDNGLCYWTLPSRSVLPCVAFVSHLSEKAVPYYEQLSNGSVSWSLPSMHENSKNNIQYIQKMNREQCNSFIGSNFDQSLSSEQMTDLDDFIEGRLEISNEGNSSDIFSNSQDDAEDTSLLAEELDGIDISDDSVVLEYSDDNIDCSSDGPNESLNSSSNNILDDVEPPDLRMSISSPRDTTFKGTVVTITSLSNYFIKVRY